MGLEWKFIAYFKKIQGMTKGYLWQAHWVKVVIH